MTEPREPLWREPLSGEPLPRESLPREPLSGEPLSREPFEPAAALPPAPASRESSGRPLIPGPVSSPAPATGEAPSGRPLDVAVAASLVPAPRRQPIWAWAAIAAGIGLAVVAIVVAMNPGPAPTLQPAGVATPSWSAAGADPVAYAQELVAGTNTARATAGLEPLGLSECARAAAADRAQALTGGRELTHASLVPVMEACDPSGPAAENLSRAAADPGAVVNAWLASPGHRANLLDPTLAQVGVACVLDTDRMLCSQVFLGP